MEMQIGLHFVARRHDARALFAQAPAAYRALTT
jgi:hypothetical protein